MNRLLVAAVAIFALMQGTHGRRSEEIMEHEASLYEQAADFVDRQRELWWGKHHRGKHKGYDDDQYLYDDKYLDGTC